MTDAAHLRATGRPATRLGALVEILTGIADRREPMVENRQLADALGCALATITDLLAQAKRGGHIEIIFTPNGKQRRVRIPSTGATSDWQPAQTFWGHSKRASKPRAPAAPLVLRIWKPGKLSFSRAMSGGYSDLAIYGHLTDAVRFCRQKGDVVHRDERNKLVILINGRPGDPMARREWHERHTARTAP